MAFPTNTVVLDNFNRSNTGPPPSSSWTSGIFGADAGLKVVSNTLKAVTNAVVNSGWWNVGTFGPDCEAYIDLPTLALDVYLMARLQSPGSAAGDGYAAEVNNSGNTHVYRIDNGSFTDLGFIGAGGDFANGDTLGFECVGSTLKVYRKRSGSWTTIGSKTDSTYTGAGYLGIYLADTTGVMDNFGGGTVVPDALVRQPMIRPLAAAQRAANW